MQHPQQPQVLQVKEVLGPAEQGKSLPFKCIAEDGYLYFVKGQQTNRASLWREWICAHVAQAFGLNIPPFSLVQIGKELHSELPADWRQLGCLPAFGSRQHRGTSWLELGMAPQVPRSIQRDVLVFDWWVRNGDRLTGNPNLLWDQQNQSLVVIDHNMALDPDFGAADFLQHHVFASQWPELEADLVSRAEYGRRLNEALPAATLAVQTAPEEWLWENSEFDLPANFDQEAALASLSRCATDELWRTV
jgi:hypothetical protein